MIELDAARVWDRLPRDVRQRLARFVDDTLRAELLLSLLHNMAATINEIECNAADIDASELLDDEDDEDDETGAEGAEASADDDETGAEPEADDASA